MPLLFVLAHARILLPFRTGLNIGEETGDVFGSLTISNLHVLCLSTSHGYSPARLECVQSVRRCEQR